MFKLYSSDFTHMLKWVTCLNVNVKHVGVGEIIYCDELTIEEIHFLKSKKVEVKRVLPSINELNLRFSSEVAAFCANFKSSYKSYSSFQWDNSDRSISIVARFEKSPLLILQEKEKEYILPNYGEDLEEIVTSNWGYIKHKIPS